MSKNFIGLDTEKTQSLANALNDLLSNYQIFYMNVRGYHWNIKGDNFFELHAKFEELYDDLLLKIDEIAERVLTLGSQLEGCVVHDSAEILYVGEEDVGVWRFDFDPSGPTEALEVARVDRIRIKDDVEGLTILRDGGIDYLIVSSQGDSTYPVYRIEGQRHIYVGRFAIVDGPGIDGVTSTDGLDAFSGPIGPFPEGAVAFHDDIDSPSPGQQNYKIVDWRVIREALGL